MALTPAPRWSCQNFSLWRAEDGRAAVVAGGVVGHRAGEGDVEAGRLGAVDDALAPVGVDLAGEVDLPGHGGGSYDSRSLSTRRRILPDGDFGISSTTSSARSRL